MPTVRYQVWGRVQGVGYRYFAWRAANELGLKGFCRNLPNGSVEVLAEGDTGSLQELERRLNEGPSFARVEGVARDESTPRGYDSFDIR
jgi:acylphosphatase